MLSVLSPTGNVWRLEVHKGVGKNKVPVREEAKHRAKEEKQTGGLGSSTGQGPVAAGGLTEEKIVIY